MKLYIINKFLNEFDTARSTNDINKLVEDLERVNTEIYSIINTYNKDDAFKSILEFIATEINFTIENEFNSLDNKEVRNG